MKGLAIALSSRDPPKVAHVLSLRSGVRRNMLDGQAAAVVFVHQTTLGTPLPLEVMSRTYRLTAGEVSVLAILTESRSVAHMAMILDISETTVKTHLQRLFAKTATRRQVELVKLLAAHASPVKA